MHINEHVIRRMGGAALAALLITAFVPALSAGASPTAGNRTRASAEWLIPTKTRNHFKWLVVNVEELRTPEGETLTTAYVGRGSCDVDGNKQVCEGSGEKIRAATLAYDTLLSTASARIVIAGGRVVKVAWREAEAAPAGVESAQEQCGDYGGSAIAVSKNAIATARLYGRRVETEIPRDRASLSTGVRETEC